MNDGMSLEPFNSPLYKGPYPSRWAHLSRFPSDLVSGTAGTYDSDTGLKLYTQERPDLNNEKDVSDIPRGLKYLAVWLWSEKHKKNLYHLIAFINQDGTLSPLPGGRTVIELHSANVMYQLEGCIAFGMGLAQFKAGSIHDCMPPVDCQGITESVTALAKMEADMRDEKGEQQPFVLSIS